MIKSEKEYEALKTIAEISRITSLTPSTLRYWEKYFTHLKPVKIHNIRYYDPNSVELLEMIKNLVYVKNFSLLKANEIIEEIYKLNNKNHVKKVIRELKEARSHLS